MLSRLAPSRLSVLPRFISSLASPKLSTTRSSVRPTTPSALSFRRSFTATADVTPRSVYVTNESLIKAFDELRIQSTSWTDEKKLAVDKEIKSAQKSGGDAAAIAVIQKNLLQRTTFTDIVNKFGGWYPLLGLTAVTAFSKELIILNEELLLATNFIFVIGAIYVNYSDVIVEQFLADRAAWTKAQKEVRELEIDTNKALIAAYEKNPLVYSMLKDLKSEYNTLFEKKVQVNFARQRIAAHQAVSKKLDEIFAKEMEEQVRLRTYIQKSATEYVLQKYSQLSAEKKTLTIDNAIGLFAGEPENINKDPVRQLYLEYFNNADWGKDEVDDGKDE